MNQIFIILNIFKQLLKVKRFFIIINKIKKRFFDKEKESDKEILMHWLKNNISDLESYLKKIDSKLWNETFLETKKIEKFANQKLSSIPYKLGGGGAYELLYFLTRYTKAEVILETGVAAGFSSSAFLTAIRRNKLGKLYSSDFPYFRLPHPEKYIGFVVEDKLKDNWQLFIEGDENNLEEIISNIKKDGKKSIDIFHYDSDKSYSGRQKCFNIIADLLSQDSIVIMDDIQDNNFFYDYISKNKKLPWKIFQYHGKYLGLIGRIEGN
jgi:predicted O-methyltransferase YrrM